MTSPPETIRPQDLVSSKEFNFGVSRLWSHFLDFTMIPRKTGSEQEMIDYVINFAKGRKFEHEKDTIGNVLIEVPPTPGYENAPGVILQGHLDMVCDGEPDPAKYGVVTALEDNREWLRAENSTLGADNGIGVSAILALADEKIPHGPMALLLTVNEEVGLVGAMNLSLKNKLEKYKYLLNFDSEEEGEATISCAGGGYTIISLPYEKQPIVDKTLVTLSVKNLMGGHSGLEVGENRINGIKVLTEVLSAISSKQQVINLVSINGGSAGNIIPHNTEAVLALDPDQKDSLAPLIEEVKNRVLSQSKHDEEKALEISITEFEGEPDSMMTHKSSLELLSCLSELPTGVISMSQSVKSLVETSTNLATINSDDSQITIEMMTRSSVDQDVTTVRGNIEKIANEYGATVEQHDPYPGWPANPNSEIISLAKQEWEKLTGEQLKIIAVHAGLECGAIIGKYPHLEAISIGPTIKGAHSVNEKVHTPSVEIFYNLARSLIHSIAEQR